MKAVKKKPDLNLPLVKKKNLKVSPKIKVCIHMYPPRQSVSISVSVPVTNAIIRQLPPQPKNERQLLPQQKASKKPNPSLKGRMALTKQTAPTLLTTRTVKAKRKRRMSRLLRIRLRVVFLLRRPLRLRVRLCRRKVVLLRRRNDGDDGDDLWFCRLVMIFPVALG